MVRLEVSEDLITFLKGAVWVGGVFLVIYATIGVAFFGFDVHKAKASLEDHLKESKALLADTETRQKRIRDTEIELSKLKVQFEIALGRVQDKVEELGAIVEEYADKEWNSRRVAHPEPNDRTTFEERTTPLTKEEIEQRQATVGPSDLPVDDGLAAMLRGASKQGGIHGLAQGFKRPLARSTPDLIREIISSSRFEWTTIGRLENKTGLSREVILDAARSMSDVEIGFSNLSRDHIFRIKNTS